MLRASPNCSPSARVEGSRPRAGGRRPGSPRAAPGRPAAARHRAGAVEAGEHQVGRVGPWADGPVRSGRNWPSHGSNHACKQVPVQPVRGTRCPRPGYYPVTERNRVRRLHERARYDHELVHAILDAAMMCHIAYVIDGLPYCTPTAFWREGTHLYWHGSSASRMLRTQKPGLPGLPDGLPPRQPRARPLRLQPLGRLPLGDVLRHRAYHRRPRREVPRARRDDRPLLPRQGPPSSAPAPRRS